MHLDQVVLCEMDDERYRQDDEVADGLHAGAHVIWARDLMIVDLAVANNAPATIMGSLDLHRRNDVLHDDFQCHGV
jgi:hypothetical protein